MNVFDRTAIFMKEPMKDGGNRIRRIPWDLISYGYGTGFFASPQPMALNALSEVTTGTSINENVEDMIAQDGVEVIDEITDIMWFDSESAFLSKFDNVFGYYETNENQSAEFGYPRV